MSNSIYKTDIDKYLFELAKELKKEYGRTVYAELIIVGGGSIIINYNFRHSTMDIDAIVNANTNIKDIIIKVADKYSLNSDWINSDFRTTDSFSDKLLQYSEYYKSFINVLDVRTIKAEYLIAMKLKSYREFKNDISDIIGILYEHEKMNMPISFDSVSSAYNALYGQPLSLEMVFLVQRLMEEPDKKKLYDRRLTAESNIKDKAADFDRNYPGVLNSDTHKELVPMIDPENTIGNIFKNESQSVSVIKMKDDTPHKKKDDFGLW